MYEVVLLIIPVISCVCGLNLCRAMTVVEPST